MQDYILVGAGGTASHLVRPLQMYLASLDRDWLLHIYDEDDVEPRNLTRQAFHADQVGMNKAAALADILYDQSHVEAHRHYIGPATIATDIRDGDIVLIAADNMYIRALIQQRAQALDDLVIINGGNEEISGSVQTYIREHGKDVTPKLSHLHPEILVDDGDRSALSCAEMAELPGGEQTIIANLTSATFMLSALWRYHQRRHHSPKGEGNTPITEIQFDHKLGLYYGWDVRMTKHALGDATD